MKKSLSSLSGKTVVITGASSGVGRATAIAFAKKGANLVLAARGEEALQSIAESCEALGVQVLRLQTDVSVAAEVQRLADAATQLNGRIDVWVNNAGVLALGPFEQMPADVLDQVIKTNLLGYMHGARAVLPIFKKQKRGVLINNISIGGWVAAPYGAAYSASKFGLRGLTESLQGELAPYPNIHVCGLYPGFQDTPGIKHAANYMGVAVSTPPPNFDPNKLAHSIVKIAANPENAAYTDWSAVVARAAYALFPSFTRNVMGTMMRFVRKEAPSEAITSGNILHPVDHDMRIEGSSRAQRKVKKVKMLGAAALGGVALWMLLRPKQEASEG